MRVAVTTVGVRGRKVVVEMSGGEAERRGFWDGMIVCGVNPVLAGREGCRRIWAGVGADDCIVAELGAVVWAGVRQFELE